jgi:hypothetical protein
MQPEGEHYLPRSAAQYNQQAIKQSEDCHLPTGFLLCSTNRRWLVQTDRRRLLLSDNPPSG